jgi:hypothetical protein
MAFDIIPAATRVRCIKMVAAAAVMYTVLWLLGFQKLFLNDAEGLAPFFKSSARSTVSCTHSQPT